MNVAPTATFGSPADLGCLADFAEQVPKSFHLIRIERFKLKP